MTQIQILINFLIAILIGSLTAYFADSRGRNPVAWFFIGMFFGILGFLSLFIFPKITDDTSKESVELAEQIAPRLSDKWFYLDEAHKQFGPVTLSEFVELCKEKKIIPSTYVWTDGMHEWKRLETLNDLLRYVQDKIKKL